MFTLRLPGVVDTYVGTVVSLSSSVVTAAGVVISRVALGLGVLEKLRALVVLLLASLRD